MRPDFQIEIVYSDEQLVVVNKPSGLLSVPGRGPDKADCLLSRLQDQFPTIRVVHRLDCATSGLMVLALDADSHRELSRQFHDREV
ncbi:pseudouridine synthase, partial [Oleiphilus sp. HI0086]